MGWTNRIVGAAIVSFALGLGFASSAQAGYVVTLSQVGNNVVANGSGAIDLSGLSGPATGDTMNDGIASNHYLGIGGAHGDNMDAYSGFFGPSSFGSESGLITPSADSGNPVAINTSVIIILVPSGYTSGTSLTDSGTWDNYSFANLGLTAGKSYEWTWGSGGANQNFTIDISSIKTVPDPTTLALLVPGLAGLGFFRRRKRAS